VLYDSLFLYLQFVFELELLWLFALSNASQNSRIADYFSSKKIHQRQQ